MVPLPQILVVNTGATKVYSSDRVTFPIIVQQPDTTCPEAYNAERLLEVGYLWTQTSGPAVDTTIPDIARTKTTSKLSIPGGVLRAATTYSFTVTASLTQSPGRSVSTDVSIYVGYRDIVFDRRIGADRIHPQVGPATCSQHVIQPDLEPSFPESDGIL